MLLTARVTKVPGRYKKNDSDGVRRSSAIGETHSKDATLGFWANACRVAALWYAACNTTHPLKDLHPTD